MNFLGETKEKFQAYTLSARNHIPFYCTVSFTSIFFLEEMVNDVT